MFQKRFFSLLRAVRHRNRLTIRAAVLGLFSAAAVQISGAVAEPVVKELSGAKVQSTYQQWTLEEMRSAKPMPMPKAIMKPGTQPMKSMPRDLDPPMVMPGWNPMSGKAQPKASFLPLSQSERKALELNGVTVQPQYNVPPGSPPAHPLDFANYGPFQRWTHFGNYTVFPRSVIGKLIIDTGQGTSVCTATVVQKSMIITAGHCVSDGQGKIFNRFLFCPSWYRGSGQGAPHPAVGCWAGVAVVTTSQWHNQAQLDRDYACIVLAPTGTVHNKKVGDVTGWAGVAVNFPPRNLKMSFGYPAGSPFPGYHIIQVAGVEWYIYDRVPNDGAFSVYMGNDMTGGSSGGPWILNWEHRQFVYPARDQSDLTDPFAGQTNMPYVSGVNSHSRCLKNCGTPTQTSGLFIAEMGSPFFFSSQNDNEDVVDILNACAKKGGI